MYSKNDYRYYLQARLMRSDDFLAHYGVLGMKWGVRNDQRISNLNVKRSANQEKIRQYTDKLNTEGAKKRAAKAAKYQAKLSKIDKKAAKARAKLAKGKTISKGQAKKIAKAEKYRAKVAKNSAKNDKYQSKIAKLEKKNAKLDKKINKMSQPSRKGANAYKKGLNQLDQKTIQKAYKTQTTRNQDKKKQYKEEFTNYVNERNLTIKDATQRGYEVSSKPKMRNVSPGTTAALFAISGGQVYSSRTMQGTKYSVKKPKNKK